MTHGRPDGRRDPDLRDVDAIVRSALSNLNGAAPTAALLARIGGRSPRALADTASAIVARRVALVAAVVFGALSFIDRDPRLDDSVAQPTDSSLFAWIVPDETDVETRAPAETLVAELFATEVPE